MIIEDQFPTEGVVTDDGNIQRTAIAGPSVRCEGNCYKRTGHYFDLEVWDTKGVRRYQVVLRCGVCDYGGYIVTPEDESWWKRLLKNPTARELLKDCH